MVVTAWPGEGFESLFRRSGAFCVVHNIAESLWRMSRDRWTSVERSRSAAYEETASDSASCLEATGGSAARAEAACL